jgi:UDP-N-acetylglucosamine 4,6-dehydratase (inverting)
MLKNASILITGGTGSFGNSFVEYIQKNRINFKKIVIFSRDEFKQDILEKKIPENLRKKFRFFLGDVRDKSRLISAFENIDIVIHAAALKQVPKAEYDPFEFIQTNIIGAQNVISASIQCGVKKVVALSTDKASSPINLYGATKLCSDKLFISANNIKGLNEINFSVIRYGNVFGSRGSVFLELKKNKEESFVTDVKMTRFSILLDDAIKLTLWVIKNAIGGEIIVPKIPSYRILDFVNAVNPNSKIKIVGLRPGEKIHEEMISVNESSNTLELKDKYLIASSLNKKNIFNYYKKKFNTKQVDKNFSYTSDKNIFLSVSQIKNLIFNNCS